MCDSQLLGENTRVFRTITWFASVNLFALIKLSELSYFLIFGFARIRGFAHELVAISNLNTDFVGLPPCHGSWLGCYVGRDDLQKGPKNVSTLQSFLHTACTGAMQAKHKLKSCTHRSGRKNTEEGIGGGKSPTLKPRSTGLVCQMMSIP